MTHRQVDTIFRRLSTLASTYTQAGGENPRLLVHDGATGVEMIALAARFGRGLPSDVIPLETDALSGFGHAEIMAALACGFGEVNILAFPKSELDVIEGQFALATALSGRDTIHLLQPGDPDAMSEMLYKETAAPDSLRSNIAHGHPPPSGQIGRQSAATRGHCGRTA